MKLKVSLYLMFAVALSGCVDIPNFDNTPKIYYNGVDQYTESDSVSGKLQRTEVVTVTVDFEDGDGDLGASSDNIQDSLFTLPYLKVPGWNLEANYELVTMVMNKDSSFTESVLPGDQFKFYPLLKPDGKAGPIKGKLDLHINFRYLDTSVPGKVKFKVRIIDRAFHISNQIETDLVTVPIYKL